MKQRVRSGWLGSRKRHIPWLDVAARPAGTDADKGALARIRHMGSRKAAGLRPPCPTTARVQMEQGKQHAARQLCCRSWPLHRTIPTSHHSISNSPAPVQDVIFVQVRHRLCHLHLQQQQQGASISQGLSAAWQPSSPNVHQAHHAPACRQACRASPARKHAGWHATSAQPPPAPMQALLCCAPAQRWRLPAARCTAVPARAGGR